MSLLPLSSALQNTGVVITIFDQAASGKYAEFLQSPEGWAGNEPVVWGQGVVEGIGYYALSQQTPGPAMYFACGTAQQSARSPLMAWGLQRWKPTTAASSISSFDHMLL